MTLERFFMHHAMYILKEGTYRFCKKYTKDDAPQSLLSCNPAWYPYDTKAPSIIIFPLTLINSTCIMFKCWTNPNGLLDRVNANSTYVWRRVDFCLKIRQHAPVIFFLVKGRCSLVIPQNPNSWNVTERAELSPQHVYKIKIIRIMKWSTLKKT